MWADVAVKIIGPVTEAGAVMSSAINDAAVDALLAMGAVYCGGLLIFLAVRYLHHRWPW